MINDAKTACASLKPEGKLINKLQSVIAMLERFSRAIDVAIQQRPNVTPLVWGTIRIVIQMVIDDEALSTLALEGVETIANQLGRWREQLRTFRGYERVLLAMRDLYVEIFDVLETTKKIAARGRTRLGRVGRTILVQLRSSVSGHGSLTMPKFVSLEPHTVCCCLSEKLARLNKPQRGWIRRRNPLVSLIRGVHFRRRLWIANWRSCP